MRTPTPPDVLYRWHDAALRGEAPPVHDDDPQCGWYQRRLVKNGPFVEAAIWCVSPTDPDTGELTADEQLACMVAGELRNARDQWSYLAGNPISDEQYRRLRDARRRLVDKVDPNAPIDHLQTPLPF